MQSFIVCTAFVVTAFYCLPAQEKSLGDKAADALEKLKRETRGIAGSAVRSAREGWNKTGSARKSLDGSLDLLGGAIDLALDELRGSA